MFPKFDLLWSAQVKLVTRKLDGKQFALKCLNKRKLMMSDQKTSLKNEIQTLREHGSPFIINLEAVMQTKTEVHLLLEVCPGGEFTQVTKPLTL